MNCSDFHLPRSEYSHIAIKYIRHMISEIQLISIAVVNHELKQLSRRKNKLRNLLLVVELTPLPAGRYVAPTVLEYLYD